MPRCCRTLRRRARRARSLRWPAELGYARVAVGCAHSRAGAVNMDRARVAVGRARAVQLGRARFRPSDTRISFSIF
jgi:hypothetical protein